MPLEDITVLSKAIWTTMLAWPVSTPLAGMPTALKLNASVPTGENSSLLSPMELKYWIPWSRATVDGW